MTDYWMAAAVMAAGLALCARYEWRRDNRRDARLLAACGAGSALLGLALGGL